MKRDRAVEEMVKFLQDEKISREEAPEVLDDLRCQALEVFVDSGLYVLKKNNILQEFDKEKLRNSIANASDASEQSMTAADLNLIIDEVRQWAEAHGRNVLSTYNIRQIIEKDLLEQGFSKVAEAYKSF